MKNNKWIGWLPASILTALSLPASAALVMHEAFNYTAGEALHGQTGGTGLNGAWSATEPGSGGFTDTIVSGLSFGTLATSGSAVQLASSGGGERFRRELGVSYAGVQYTSFLLNVVSHDTNQSEATVLIGTADTNTNSSQYLFSGDGYWTNKGGARISGTSADFGGSQITLNTSFLYLFKTTSNATDQQVDGWLLSSAQFDYFKTGGLTEAELNSAGEGSGGTDVWGRLSTSKSAALGAMTHIQLAADTGSPASSIYDELRIGGSLDDVTPVIPEPSTSLLAGLACMGLLVRRRRTL